jgi:mRNA-degrading endonuclease toxin of MazEF toxin-antitoxin module
VRRGEVWRYEPVIARAGQSTLRLVVSADSINADNALPTVYVMQVVETDPGSLLAVRIGDLGWAFALLVDRPVRKRLTDRVGAATVEEMEQVDAALRATLEL